MRYLSNNAAVFALSFFLLSSKVSALYQGNPASCDFPTQGFFISEESAVSAKLGYQIEYVFDRKLKLTDQSADVFPLAEKASFLFNQAAVTLNVIDRLEAFATFGTMQFSLKRNLFSDVEEKLRSNNGFTWSIGGRTLLIFWDQTSLGIAASYLVSYPHLKERVQSNLSYNEWQIEVALSQKIAPVSLYLGGAYSSAELGIRKHEMYKNRCNISIVMGISVFAKKGFTMNAEAKFFGETSLAGSFDFRF